MRRNEREEKRGFGELLMVLGAYLVSSKLPPQASWGFEGDPRATRTAQQEAEPTQQQRLKTEPQKKPRLATEMRSLFVRC